MHSSLSNASAMGCVFIFRYSLIHAMFANRCDRLPGQSTSNFLLVMFGVSSLVMYAVRTDLLVVFFGYRL